MKHAPPQTVIVRFDQRGEISYLVNGSHVRLVIVDERAPDDRVFEWEPRDSKKAIASMLKGDVR